MRMAGEGGVGEEGWSRDPCLELLKGIDVGAVEHKHGRVHGGQQRPR